MLEAETEGYEKHQNVIFRCCHGSCDFSIPWTRDRNRDLTKDIKAYLC